MNIRKVIKNIIINQSIKIYINQNLYSAP